MSTSANEWQVVDRGILRLVGRIDPEAAERLMRERLRSTAERLGTARAEPDRGEKGRPASR